MELKLFSFPKAWTLQHRLAHERTKGELEINASRLKWGIKQYEMAALIGSRHLADRKL
jgi:hypothetical protein